MNDDEILLFLEQNNFFLKNGAASPRALKRLNDFPNIKSLLRALLKSFYWFHVLYSLCLNQNLAALFLSILALI